VEIDFADHPDSSSKYYVVAADGGEQLTQHLPPPLLTYLGEYDGLHLEARGSDLVADWPEVLSPGAAERAFRCFLGIAGHIPRVTGYR